MPTIMTRAALKRRNEKLKKRLQENREKAITASEQARNAQREVRDLRQRVEELERGYVVEWCEYCETEVQMVWNVEQDGYKAYCPFCGHRLMLCDECQHRSTDGSYTGDCDYYYGTDTCRFNKKEGETE